MSLHVDTWTSDLSLSALLTSGKDPCERLGYRPSQVETYAGQHQAEAPPIRADMGELIAEVALRLLFRSNQPQAGVGVNGAGPSEQVDFGDQVMILSPFYWKAPHWHVS